MAEATAACARRSSGENLRRSSPCVTSGSFSLNTPPSAVMMFDMVSLRRCVGVVSLSGVLPAARDFASSMTCLPSNPMAAARSRQSAASFSRSSTLSLGSRVFVVTLSIAAGDESPSSLAFSTIASRRLLNSSIASLGTPLISNWPCLPVRRVT